MDIRELRSFCTVAELRSVTKAADRLGLGQPTVSSHIKTLENEIGNLLFDRDKRPLQLTVIGTRLFEVVSPMLGRFDALRNDLIGSTGPRSITFAVTSELVAHAAASGISAYRRDHPDVDLRVKSGRASEVLQMVRTREAILGLMPDIEGEHSVTAECVFVCERVLIAPKGHPILETDVTYSEVARWPLILSSGRNDARRATSWSNSIGTTRRPRC